jgi:hypothetical protein
VWRTAEGPPRGLLLPSRDPDAWARALGDLVAGVSVVPGDPGERRGFARSVFDPARHAYDLVSLYRGGSGERGAPVFSSDAHRAVGRDARAGLV